jgi:5-methyltetrahydrofolate--homocysteine methyltransferase
MDKENSRKYAESVNIKYATLRKEHDASRKSRNLLTISKARENRFVTDWKSIVPFKPVQQGIGVIKEFKLEDLERYIDWTFFFFAWKLNGKYPAILNDPVKGEEARKLFDDAAKYLREIKERKIITSRGVYGIFPAASEGDDIIIFSPDNNVDKGRKLVFLRNQEVKENDVRNLCLADYIAPVSAGIKDYLGAFVVTADIDEPKMAEYRSDDYANIMIRILGDRLAEATAEMLHENIRKYYWGYSPEENYSADELFRNAYKGIRPAPGYPACPDHTEKRTLFDLLEVEKNIGVTLTENFAMVPVSSVSAYVFAHPGSTYFNIGKIGADQLSDYAARKKFTIQEASRWLSQNL